MRYQPDHGAVSYTWTNDVTNGSAFTPTITATYTVNGTDANGCTGTASVEIVVNACTSGINTFSSQNEINVYPNPATDIVTIKSASPISSIKIVNIFGETVYTAELQNTEATLNLTNLSNGNYLIQLFTDKGMILKKIIVQK